MMLQGKVTYVKALQDFFTSPPHGKRVEIPEFKSLTQKDKVELREMLIGEGYDVLPLPEPTTS